MKTSTSKKANELLNGDNLIILDLETTGFLTEDPEAKIVQMTLMNGSGKIIFSSLINPQRSIPPAATKAHGIKDSDVKKAPTLREVIPFVKKFLDNSSLAVYNAAFDVHFLTHRLNQLGEADKFFFKEINCVMEMYQSWSGSTRWLPLPNLSGGKKHDSTVDCLNTLLLLQKMAGKEEKEVIDLDF